MKKTILVFLFVVVLTACSGDSSYSRFEENRVYQVECYSAGTHVYSKVLTQHKIPGTQSFGYFDESDNHIRITFEDCIYTEIK